MTPPSSASKLGRATLIAAFVLFGITLVAGLLGFGVIPSSILPYTKIVFFVAGTLCVAALMVGLVRS